MSYVIIEGTTIRFYTKRPFADFAGNVVDPDRVEFSYRVANGTVTTYVYGSGDGVVVRDSKGYYHADIDSDGSKGTWTYSWYGYPTSANTDPTRTKVKFEGNVQVSVSTV